MEQFTKEPSLRNSDFFDQNVLSTKGRELARLEHKKISSQLIENHQAIWETLIDEQKFILAGEISQAINSQITAGAKILPKKPEKILTALETQRAVIIYARQDESLSFYRFALYDSLHSSEQYPNVFEVGALVGNPKIHAKQDHSILGFDYQQDYKPGAAVVGAVTELAQIKNPDIPIIGTVRALPSFLALKQAGFEHLNFADQLSIQTFSCTAACVGNVYQGCTSESIGCTVRDSDIQNAGCQLMIYNPETLRVFEASIQIKRQNIQELRNFLSLN